MSSIADDIIDGIFDEQTGEYIGEGVGYPRTMNIRREDNAVVKKVRAELQALIKSKKGIPNALNEARSEINKKYGKGWRDNLNN